MICDLCLMERFIANRLYSQNDSVSGGTRPAMVIATIGVALGLLVMVLSIAVTRGFRNEIRAKVTGFTQDIQLTNYGSQIGVDEVPITCTSQILDSIKSAENVSHAQRYVQKAGILRTDSAFQGIVLKGVGQEYDFSFFSQCLEEGSLPVCTDSVASGGLLLSRTLADKLLLSVGDRVDIYFMQDRIRMRRLTLTGIYKTDFSSYDELYGITDIHTMQQLSGWNATQSGGVEIAVDDDDKLYDAYLSIHSVLETASEQTGEQYLVQATEQINAGLFAWLDVLNVNVWVILILMLGIAGFTMISGLLIIIFENTRTIGILKALGAQDVSVRKIFLYLSARIVGKGMMIGNILGIGLCLAQHYFKIIPLDPKNYYLDSVPCELGVGWLLTLNLTMFLLSMLMLVGPSAVISRISPSRSIRFE